MSSCQVPTTSSMQVRLWFFVSSSPQVNGSLGNNVWSLKNQLTHQPKWDYSKPWSHTWLSWCWCRYQIIYIHRFSSCFTLNLISQVWTRRTSWHGDQIIKPYKLCLNHNHLKFPWTMILCWCSYQTI